MANFTDGTMVSTAVPTAINAIGVRIALSQVGRVSYMGLPDFHRHLLQPTVIQPVAYTNDIETVQLQVSGGGFPPTVSNISPANLSTLLPADPLSFEITFLNGERRTLLAVEYPTVDDLPTELVHDGDEFEPTYSQSSRLVITGGWKYIVRRRGGWTAPPQLKLFAFDRVGLEL